MECAEKGYFFEEMIDFPSLERMAQRPVAVAECCQQIPCNPCVDACPAGAITIRENINFIPHINFDKCTGCGLCLGVCPGLSIFLVDLSKEKASVTIPYELFPPEKEETVELLDRTGKSCGTGKVIRIRQLKQHDRTLLITLEVEPALINRVRGFRRQS